MTSSGLLSTATGLDSTGLRGIFTSKASGARSSSELLRADESTESGGVRGCTAFRGEYSVTLSKAMGLNRTSFTTSPDELLSDGDGVAP